MNNSLLPSLWRFLLLWTIQIFVLQPIAETGGRWLSAFVYPIFILLLPVTTPGTLAVLLGFGMGICIDIFYSSPGVHAGASVFTAWIRTVLLQIMEPRGGYAGNQIPSASHFGMTWFLQFSAVVMAGHLLVYYSLDAFSFVYTLSILGKTTIAFTLSMLFLLIYQQLFNPKN